MVLKVTVQYNIPGTSFIRKRRDRAKRPIQDVELAETDNSDNSVAVIVAAIVAAAPVYIWSWPADLTAVARTCVELVSTEDIASNGDNLYFVPFVTLDRMLHLPTFEGLDPKRFLIPYWRFGSVGEASPATEVKTGLSQVSQVKFCRAD